MNLKPHKGILYFLAGSSKAHYNNFIICSLILMSIICPVIGREDRKMAYKTCQGLPNALRTNSKLQCGWNLVN